MSLINPVNLHMIFVSRNGKLQSSVFGKVQFVNPETIFMEGTRQSSRKQQEVSDTVQNIPPIDRLSALPDDIICRILSFLPTHISAATSILARRWRFLWAHVPNLNFECYARSSNIISNVMLLHKVQTLNTFRLQYRCVDFSKYELETWITTAIERKVQNLDLDLMVVLPQRLFTCKTLVSLTLHNCEGIPSSGVVSLPSLKKLHLDNVDYQLDLPKLLSGCPVLEELIMIGNLDHDFGCFNISSLTIKRLTIDFAVDSYVFDNPDYRVKINAPALRYLQVYDCSFEHISVSPITSLIDADIWLRTLPNDFCARCVLKFLDSLCNVKFLKLSGRHNEFPDLGVAGPYVRFDNLIKLELAADWCLLTKFLESADNLEVLIIREVDSCLKYWMEPHQVPSCLLSHLKTMTIDRFGHTEDEFNMIRYVLWNAQVLERMEIYSQWDYFDIKERFDALKRISSFQRGSACELLFH